MLSSFQRSKWLLIFLFAFIHLNLFAQQATYSNTLSFDDPDQLENAKMKVSTTIRMGDWTKSPYHFSTDTICYLVLFKSDDRNLTEVEQYYTRWFGRLPTSQEQVERDFHGRVKIVGVEVVLFESLDESSLALLHKIYPSINFQDTSIAKKYFGTAVTKIALSRF